MIEEVEIVNGMRAWPESQVALRGATDPSQVFDVLACWYDTDIEEHEGAFCLVDVGGPLADLVGDFVRVTHAGREAFVYCLGQEDLPCEIGLARRAFMALEFLNVSEIDVTVEVVG